MYFAPIVATMVITLGIGYLFLVLISSDPQLEPQNIAD
jgi:hypothetical protein